MSEPGLTERAAELDAADPLARLRDAFDIEDDLVYLDGNSLGALPRSVAPRLADVLGREWGRQLIRSWWDSGWWTAPERVGDRIAPLIGAAPGQVVVGDSTSVNLFKAVVAGVRLARRRDPARDEVLVDAETFPTDAYIAGSAARLTGARLRTLPADRLTTALGPRTAVALVNHVDFGTGTLRDLPALTAATHEAGALAVWDLCHSVGALPVGVDAHGVDLAVGCTYKYLNGGPGAPAFLYVRSGLQPLVDQPLPGWHSHVRPFGMESAYVPADGIISARTGTPEILSLLALDAALDVWAGVRLDEVRTKSLALTDFFLECVNALLPNEAVTCLTPVEHHRRGSQIALRHPRGEEVMAGLAERRVIGDFRPPDVLRFGFAPLYTRYADALRAAHAIAGVLGG